MNAVRELPPITISNYDFDRLVIYSLDAFLRGDRDAGFLLSELKRAELCPALELSEEIVTVNCRAIYRLDDERSLRSDFLVHPCDLIRCDEISACSPLGTALLGLKVGDRMPFIDTKSGREHVVAVEAIGIRFIEDGPRTDALVVR